jgi:hypothetical protein
MTPNAAPPMLHKMAMVTISISAEADRAITGGSPEPSLRDDRGGYRFIVDHKTLDRLTAARRPGESYSDVIVRLAKGDGGEE